MLLLANVMAGVAAMLSWLLWFYQFILIGYVIISWVGADPRNPIVSFLHAAVDPLLRVIRRWLPMSLRYFPIDIAFLVLVLLVIFVNYGVVSTLADYARLLRYNAGGGALQG